MKMDTNPKNQTIHLGNHTIEVKETKEGRIIAKLSSGFSFGVLEVEKTEKGEVRLKEMELGSAYVTAEQLALLLYHTNLAENVLDSIEKVCKLMTKTANMVNLGSLNIVVTVDKNGGKTARLNSGESFGVIEMEKTSKGIRVKEMELGSAILTTEHFAAVLFFADLDDEVVVEINKVKEYYSNNN